MAFTPATLAEPQVSVNQEMPAAQTRAAGAPEQKWPIC